DARQPMEYLQHHIHKPPVPLRQRAPDRNIPQAVEDVVMRALAKKREDRWQTAAEFGRALRDALPRPVATVALRALPGGLPDPSAAAGSPPTTVASASAPASPTAQPPAAAANASGASAPSPPRVAPGTESAPALPSSSTPWIVLGLGVVMLLVGLGALVFALMSD
ncbi:MAG: hypothetical protein RMK74_16760, partial [Myxococcales bacterium]|nr:hypothetical protein [Myxococcales bacterium]